MFSQHAGGVVGVATELCCVQGFRYSVAFNSTAVHSLPMTVNILSNALLRGLNATPRIRTWTKPFDYVSAPPAGCGGAGSSAHLEAPQLMN